MSATDKAQAVGLVEGDGDVLTKVVPSATRRDPPALIIKRIGPEKVAERPLVRNLLQPIHRPHLVQAVDAWAEAAVESEHLVVNEGGDGKVVKYFGQAFPHPRVSKFPLALVVEAVSLSGLSALMVSPQQGQSGRIAHLQAEQEQKCLNAKVAPVHVVAHEQEVGVGQPSGHPEQLHEVVKLAVDVATDGDRTRDLHYIALLQY